MLYAICYMLYVMNFKIQVDPGGVKVSMHLTPKIHQFGHRTMCFTIGVEHRVFAATKALKNDDAQLQW